MRHNSIWVGLVCSAVAFSWGAEAAQAQDRLSYPQQEAFRRIKGRYNDITRTFQNSHPKYESEKPKLKGMIVPPSYYVRYISSVDNIRKKISQIDKDVESSGLPTEHKDVKPTWDGLQAIRTKVDTWEKELRAGKAKADKMADPKSYPGIEEAFARLKELEKSFKDADFGGRAKPPVKEDKRRNKRAREEEKTREAAFALFLETGKIRKWCGETWNKYRPFVIATGGKSSNFYKQYVDTANALKSFLKDANECAEKLTKQFDESMKDAQKSLKWGIENNSDRSRAPVEKAFANAKAALDVLAMFPGYPPDNLKTRQEQYEKETKSTLAAIHDLEEKILAATRAPEEVYTESDREELREKMQAAWKRAYPDEKILAIRFHASGWKRTKKWVWTDTHETEKEWSDRSEMACIVIVKTDERVATLYPAYFNKNHVSDSMSLGVHTRGGGYVIRKMLIQNLD